MITQSTDLEQVARHRLRLRDTPPSPEHLRAAVEYFLDTGLVQEAWEPLARLVELEPTDISLWLLLGVVGVQLGHFDQAESAFQEVIRRDEHCAAALHNLALLYVATDRPQEAVAQFSAIVRREPNNAEALNDLAVLYASLSRDDEAQHAYERCVASAPGYRKGWHNALDFAYSTGRFEVGANWTEQVAVANPDDPELAAWREKFNRQLRLMNTRFSGTEPTPPSHGAVSIIVPACNAEQSIGSSLESILEQTYPDIEILVVDDGSTDDTERVVRRFADRVTYVRRVHCGWAATVNDGIQRSRGAWVLVLNPGETLLRDAVAGYVNDFVGKPEYDALGEGDGSGITPCGGTNPRLMFRRLAFARTGFFDELADDDDGSWSRRLMAVKAERACRLGFIGEQLRSAPDACEPSPGPPDPLAVYREQVLRRWMAETSTCSDKNRDADRITQPVRKKTGLSLLIIGAEDPGGMFSSLASAINTYTSHRCRVIVRAPGGDDESRVLLRTPNDAADVAGCDREVRRLAEQADWLVFATGFSPGAARRDRRLQDTAEVPWGSLDWTSYSSRKRCAAFLCSSPSVRGNYEWYYRRFAERRWLVLTSSPDIYLNVPHSHFIPPVLDLSCAEYRRTDHSVGPVVIVFHDRPGYAAGGEDMLGQVAARLKKKYGDRVLFGRCGEMTLRETLAFRRRAHIGFDRISLGAPRFGLTSLENSALGLVNIVYLDPFARALLAHTLDTEELPWVSPDSPEALHETLDRLVAEPADLQARMKRTAEWFHRYWTPERLVRSLVDVLEDA